MPGVYSAQAFAALDANTDQLLIEVTAPSNVGIKIRKIRIMHADGTETVTADYHKKVKLVRESVAGTGGSSYTPIKLDANSAAAGSTVKTDLSAVGTISDTIDVFSIHSVTDFYWQAYDDDDKISVEPSGIFGVVVNPAG